MALFQWNDSLSVGVPSIDAQHKRLVDTINQLHDAMKVGAGTKSLGGILTILIQYTGEHFKYEEQIFSKFKYPDAEAHMAEHKELVDKVLDFQKQFQGGHVTLSGEVIKFLQDWLTNHIQGTDKKYSSFFKENGIK